MENKRFKKYEKALFSDLSRVEEYSPYSFGVFMGGLDIQKIWLELDDKQFEKLREHIKETFSSKNFNWLGKRRKPSHTP